MPIRPKLSVHEIIPDGFMHFMRYVVALIDEHDEAAWMESDDLIQYEQHYGGLYDEANGRYGFEFCVQYNEDEDEFAICWEFDLDRQQIRDIASGRVTQAQFWRCDPDCGRRFQGADGYCAVCDYPPVE